MRLSNPQRVKQVNGYKHRNSFLQGLYWDDGAKKDDNQLELTN